jgi:hypothetical protein
MSEDSSHVQNIAAGDNKWENHPLPVRSGEMAISGHSPFGGSVSLAAGKYADPAARLRGCYPP